MTVVTVLTQTSCTFCDQAKETLGRLRQEHSFDIVEVSLDTDEGRTLGEGHGVLFAPGILIDGALFSFGRLSERKLRRELQRREGTPADHRPRGRAWRRQVL
jgi:glutaredoxin